VRISGALSERRPRCTSRRSIRQRLRRGRDERGWAEHALGADVDVSVEIITKSIARADELEQYSARLEIGEEVDVRLIVRLVLERPTRKP
jgi:ribosome-binding protein aMBF1 (putative translation factor)